MTVGREPGWGGRELGLRTIDMHIGSRLRLRRKALDMSQERLATALGLTVRQIRAYESGLYKIDPGRLFDLAYALNVQISFFFGDNPEGAGKDQQRSDAHEPGQSSDEFDADLRSFLANTLCFCRGTRIATRHGEKPVETLCEGDQLVTLGDGLTFTPVTRAWRRPLGLTPHPATTALAPVCIRQGSLPGNIPRRNLLVLPNIHIHLHGEVIPVARIAAPAPGTQEAPDLVAEFVPIFIRDDRPVFAEGLAVAKCPDTGTRKSEVGEYVVY